MKYRPCPSTILSAICAPDRNTAIMFVFWYKFVCLLVFFFFLLHQNFITWQSVVYGMLCQSACSSSRTGLPVASIEKEGNNNNCKNSVKKETNKRKHNTSQDFTFTLFFKTQIDSQWGIKAQLISYNYITINEFLFWKWWQQKDRGLINSARLVR